MNKHESLKVFEALGYLQLKFDGKEFKKSNLLYIKSLFILFATLIVPAKFCVSFYYEREDVRQLYIGNLFNHFGQLTF